MARLLSMAAVRAFTDALNLLDASVRAKLEARLLAIDFTDPDAAASEAVKVMEAFCRGATDAAAALAAEFYDMARADVYEGPYTFAAQAVSARVPEATRQAVQGIVRGTAAPSAIVDKLVQRLGYEVRRAAGDCVLANGRRDRASPRYARVPTGPETCPFCLMLASRGFVYTSKLAAGELDHYHANCDCRVVPSWGGSEVSGYDPTAYYDKWQAAVDEEAERMAERDGTTEREAYDAIMARYRKSADKANKRRRRQN